MLVHSLFFDRSSVAFEMRILDDLYFGTGHHIKE